MSKSDPLVVIVMPAYNEARNIARVIAEIPENLTIEAHNFTIAVVVVDDGSADNTYDAARKTRAIVLKHLMNSGAGAATRTGLRYIRQCLPQAKYIISIDADGQHHTSDIKHLIAFAEEHQADMIVGNRLHAGNREHMPASRRLGNWGLSLISRILFGITTEDTQSGLRLLSQRALAAVSDYTIDRYGFCTEMLWYAVRAGITIYEVPIAVKYSKETLANGQSSWGVLDLVRDLIWIRISR